MKFMTVSEAARKYPLSVKTIRKYIHRGLIPAVKHSPTAPWIFRQSDFEKFLSPQSIDPVMVDNFLEGKEIT